MPARTAPYLHEQIVALYQQGVRAPQIVETLGIVSTTAVYRVLARSGIERPKDWYRKFTPDVEAEIAAAYAEDVLPEVLAEKYGCSQPTIRNVVRREGGRLRPKGPRQRKLSPAQEDEAVALYQGGLSQVQVGAQIGVSQSVIGRILATKGAAVRKTSAARGASHGSWRGGRVSAGQGYMAVYVSDDSPWAAMRNNQAYVLEHRLVMAQMIGRCLLPSETVHHINGVNDDNRPENLQLRQGRHGKGVALQCIDCGSQNVRAVPLH